MPQLHDDAEDSTLSDETSQGIVDRATQLGMSMEAYLAKLGQSYTFFVQEIWNNRGLDEFAPLGWVEYSILDWVCDSSTNRKGILAPRSFGKTYLVTATYSLWRAYKDPNIIILIISKSTGEAAKTVKLIRDWIDLIPFLRDLSPSLRTTARDTTQTFDFAPAVSSRSNSVTAKGIDGQITGSRAELTIADDVETEINTKTHESRIDLQKRVSELGNITTYGSREIIYLGTYHHEESLYIHLAQERNFTFRTWPLVWPSPSEQYLGLAPQVTQRQQDDPENCQPDTLIAKYRFDDDYLAEKLAEGRSNFNMQQKLVRNLGDTLQYPLQLRDLIVFPVQRDQAPQTIAWGTNNGQGQSTRIQDIPSLGFADDGFYSPIMYDAQWLPYNGTKMWIDPSGAGADNTGYAVVSHLNGFLWAHDVGGLKGGFSPEALLELALVAKAYRVGLIQVEDFGVQAMFAQLLQPIVARQFVDPGIDAMYPDGWRCAVEPCKVPQIQKELRIIGYLEPIMNQHRLIVSRKVAQHQTLQRQLTRITRQRNSLGHEDELESLANCVGQWTDVMNTDGDKMAERRRAEAYEKRLAELCGKKVDDPRWFRL